MHCMTTARRSEKELVGNYLRIPMSLAGAHLEGRIASYLGGGVWRVAYGTAGEEELEEATLGDGETEWEMWLDEGHV